MWTIFKVFIEFVTILSLFCLGLLTSRNVRSQFPNQDGTCTSCIWKVKSQPLDHQGSPFIPFHGWIILHCMDRPHFKIHSSVDGHLYFFSILATGNNAVMNDCVCTSFVWPHRLTPLFPWYICRSGIVEWHSNPIFTLLKDLQMLSKAMALFYTPTSGGSPHAYQHLLLCFFVNIVVLVGVVSLRFDLYLLNN